ncbi:response regulator transcription factor [Amycolatopsis roodepoortensis]|uniref:Response regulator transcription factor n=2 Tax=Amycolatopsis TaxID=1813 RepID=A0ACD5B4N3_9PSEU|nr:response regulator transcription factor [Amycolatopsis roodepoortensis]MBE1574968.1 DNA-binding NarL/FixJ family response regulator [Amycolatopsis roodepoortensis]RSN06103.1 DNA-binding response regulator [Streptomyces sp. WAC 05977]UUV27801.1 response regulator transcription factor [Amycolatopsis roodepoortensis]
MIRVLLADDHAMFRSGMRAVLDTQADFECVGEAADGRDAVAQAASLRPDVAVLDVRMPKLDGLAATEAIMSAPGNDTRVLVLTTYDSDEYVYRALRAGASGFLLKSLAPEELVSAMRVAARGDALIDPTVTRRLVSTFATSIEPAAAEPAELERLTSREREVLLLVADASSNAEIAAHLHVGEETVKTHVSRILAKLGLRDRVHAVVYAYRNGLVGGR